MTHPSQTEAFINALTEMLQHDRDRRAADLMHHTKEQAKRFLRQGIGGAANSMQASRRTRPRTADAPDCV